MIVKSQRTGHTLFIKKINAAELPTGLDKIEGFTTFYVVKNFDDTGHVFFYLGKGLELAPKQICGWYPRTGRMWSSFGTSLAAVIEGMQLDGWIYA